MVDLAAELKDKKKKGIAHDALTWQKYCADL